MKTVNQEYLSRWRGTWRSQKGAALIFTIMVMMVVVTLGVAILAMARGEVRLGHLDYRQRQAFHLAQGGVEYAHSLLLEDPANRDWQEQLVLDGGSAAVVAESSSAGDNEVQVESTGTVDSPGAMAPTQRTLVAVFEVVSGWPSSLPSWEGDNYAYVGEKDIQHEHRVDDPIVEGHPFDESLLEASFWKSMGAREVSPADVEDRFELVNGEVVMVKEGFSLSNQHQGISGSGILVIDGDLEIRGGEFGDPDSHVLMVILGDLTLSGNPRVQSLLLVRGTLEVTGNARVRDPGYSSGAWEWLDEDYGGKVSVIQLRWYPRH